MKERPILFSGPMVRAILEGRKTQTRRVVKLPAGTDLIHKSYSTFIAISREIDSLRGGTVPKVQQYVKCPYGQVGDRLWVKRTHYRFGHWESRPGVKTAAGRMKWRFIPDSEDVLFDAPEVFRRGRHHKDPHTPAWHKRSSLFMPRELAELALEIVSVRVERLQDISVGDALAEGIRCPDCGYTARDSGIHLDHAICINKRLQASKAEGVGWHPAIEEFSELFDGINGKKPGERWKDNPWVFVLEFKVIG